MNIIDRFDEFQFGDLAITRERPGATFTFRDIRYQGKTLLIQTPVMWIPWAIHAEYHSITLSFRDWELSPDLTEFKDFLERLDDRVSALLREAEGNRRFSKLTRLPSVRDDHRLHHDPELRAKAKPGATHAFDDFGKKLGLFEVSGNQYGRCILHVTGVYRDADLHFRCTYSAKQIQVYQALSQGTACMMVSEPNFKDDSRFGKPGELPLVPMGSGGSQVPCGFGQTAAAPPPPPPPPPPVYQPPPVRSLRDLVNRNKACGGTAKKRVWEEDDRAFVVSLDQIQERLANLRKPKPKAPLEDVPEEQKCLHDKLMEEIHSVSKQD